MLGRIWTTGFVPGCGDAYEVFAREISLPMFRAHDGFIGCVMTRNEREGVVLTLWRDEAAIRNLEASELYQATVAKIMAAGLLCKPQQTTTKAVHLIDVAGLKLTGDTAQQPHAQ